MTQAAKSHAETVQLAVHVLDVMSWGMIALAAVQARRMAIRLTGGGK